MSVITTLEWKHKKKFCSRLPLFLFSTCQKYYSKLGCKIYFVPNFYIYDNIIFNFGFFLNLKIAIVRKACEDDSNYYS